MEVYVTASTSAVLIDSSLLVPPITTAVVYLQSVPPGRTITIRDSAGYLSTPQTIVVSTIGANDANPSQPQITFADGTSTATITSAYGYLTVTSRDATSWILTNSFGFPQNQVIASVNSLTTETLNTGYLATSSIVTSSLQTTDLIAHSSIICSGPATYSTLVVGPPYTLSPGTAATIYGDLSAANATFVGSLRTGAFTTGSLIAGAILTTGSVTLSNDLLLSGNINAFNAAVSTNTISTASATIGLLTVSSGITCGSATLDNIATTALSTGSLYVTSQIDLSGFIITPNNGLTFSGGITTPSISTGYITASNAVTTSNLYIRRSIFASTLQIMQLSSTQIINPNGSLSISSMVADALTTNTLSTNSVDTQLLAVSTITLNGNLDIAGSITMDSATLTSLSTVTLYGDSITANNFAVGSLAVDNINITGTFTGSNITILNIPNALITANSILTSNLATSTITTNNLYITGFISTGSTLNIDASNVVTTNISTTSLHTSTVFTSSLTANKIIVGSPINPTLRGPYFVCTGSTNCVITGGPGDYYTPLFLSNVKPAGYTSNTPYPVSATFQYIIPTQGGYIPGNLVSLQASLFWANELACKSFVIPQSGDAGGAINLYGYYAQDSTSNTTPNQQYQNLLPNAYAWSATMINDSRATVTIQSQSNVNYSLANYDTCINMQNGILKWNYALNDTTIQNSLNDISTRNLLYYGSLNFISDPRLKKDIEDADLGRCHEIIRDIPLYRYAFKDSYVTTFGITDIHRLGIMADEYETFFPKSVTKQEIPGFSTVKTVDTQQLDMAHLGATQYLLKEVEALRSTVKGVIENRESK